LASLFGAGLVESLALPPTGPAASLAGLTITAGGRPAPLLFATPYQANLQLPYELPPGVHAVEVTSGFGAARFDVSLDEAAPGIFVLDSGRGAVLNQDGTLNAPLNPAARGSVLQVFVTGLGAVAPSIATGAAAPNSPLSRAVAPLTATLDGRAVEVLFAGLAPGFIGLGQVNLLVTASLPPNPETQLVLQAAGRDSNAVPVAIQ
jgi:adhesin/invasin